MPSIPDEGQVAFAGMVDGFDATGDGIAVAFDLAVDQQGDSVRGAGGFDSKELVKILIWILSLNL